MYERGSPFEKISKKMTYLWREMNECSHFRWNSYETNLLSTFEGLLDSEALSDVTLFCEGKMR